MDHIETYSQEAKCWCGKNVIGVAGEGGGVYACPMRHESFIPPCPRCARLEQENARLREDLDLIFRDTGGHFCPEWDYLFIMPGSIEYDACLCKIGGPRRRAGME